MHFSVSSCILHVPPISCSLILLSNNNDDDDDDYDDDDDDNNNNNNNNNNNKISATSCQFLSFQSKYSPQYTVLKFLQSPFCHLKHCHKESSSEKQTTCKILTATTEKDILNKLHELKFQRFLYFISSKWGIKKMIFSFHVAEYN
jgi:hypothetical protein